MFNKFIPNMNVIGVGFKKWVLKLRIGAYMLESA